MKSKLHTTASIFNMGLYSQEIFQLLFEKEFTIRIIPNPNDPDQKKKVVFKNNCKRVERRPGMIKEISPTNSSFKKK